MHDWATATAFDLKPVATGFMTKPRRASFTATGFDQNLSRPLTATGFDQNLSRPLAATGVQNLRLDPDIVWSSDSWGRVLLRATATTSWLSYGRPSGVGWVGGWVWRLAGELGGASTKPVYVARKLAKTTDTHPLGLPTVAMAGLLAADAGPRGPTQEGNADVSRSNATPRWAWGAWVATRPEARWAPRAQVAEAAIWVAEAALSPPAPRALLPPPLLRASADGLNRPHWDPDALWHFVGDARQSAAFRHAHTHTGRCLALSSAV